MSKKLDNAKGRLIIASLLLRKQLADNKSLLEDSRKQWALEYQKYYNSIYAANTSIKQAQFYKIKKYTEIYKFLHVLHTQKSNSSYNLKTHTDTDISSRPLENSHNFQESITTDRPTIDQISPNLSDNKFVYLTQSLKSMLHGGIQQHDSEVKPDWIMSKLTLVRQSIHRRLKILRKIEMERVSFLNITDSQSLVMNLEYKPRNMLHHLQVKSENVIDTHRRIFSFSYPEPESIPLCSNLAMNTYNATDTQPSITNPTPDSQYTPTLSNEDPFDMNFEQEIMGDLSESSLLEEENIRLAILNSSLLKESISFYLKTSKRINTSEILDSARLGEPSCMDQNSSHNTRSFLNVQNQESMLHIKFENSVEERRQFTESEQRNLVSNLIQPRKSKGNFLRRVCRCFYID